MAFVFIPAMLRDSAGGNDRVQVDGATVRAVIDELRRSHPMLIERLVVEDRLMDGWAVAVDGVISAQGLRTPVGPASEVHFLPALGGGACGTSPNGSHRIATGGTGDALTPTRAS